MDGRARQMVERLRADHPMWGKRKITVLLRRQGIAVSVSTVGRILTMLMESGRVSPVPMLRRLPKGLKPTRPGELVQIDTLFVNVAPDKAIKHFTGYDPVAKWTAARVANQASAASARAFLDQLLAATPFQITGIQVDGGSEFRAEFEQACAEGAQPVRAPAQATPAQRRRCSAPDEWSGLNVSSGLVGAPLGAWAAELVGVAEPAMRRELARTPRGPVPCSQGPHAAGRHCNAGASSR